MRSRKTLAHRAKLDDEFLNVRRMRARLAQEHERRQHPMEGAREAGTEVSGSRAPSSRSAAAALKTFGALTQQLLSITRPVASSKAVSARMWFETYENGTRTRVAFVNEIRGLSMKQRMHDDEKADVRSKLAAFAQELGIVEAPANNAADDAVDDANHDVPF